jgi:hypothetical protein
MPEQNPVARRAAILIANTTGTPEEIAAALDSAGMLQRPAMQVPGPYPLLVRTTGLGAAIDVHHLVFALFRALAAEAVEDPEGVAEELAAIADASPDGSSALLEVLTDRLGGTEVRYGASAMRGLAARLLAAAGPKFPHQLDRRKDVA